MIRPLSKIHSIVKEYPELLEVLIGQAPVFKKLKNRVMFNTIAKLASVEDAAKIGGLSLEELLLVLNKAIGKEKEYLSNKGQILSDSSEDQTNESVMQRETVEEAMNVEEFEVLDARKLGENAFEEIMKLVDKTEVGRGFCIIQSFEPIPLYRVMGKKGFNKKMVRVTEDEYRVYFTKTEEKV